MEIEDHSESSTMVVHKKNIWLTSFTPSIDAFSCFCTHCNSTKHMVDVWWKKHGYPECYKLKQAERKNKKSTQVFLTDAIPLASTSQVSRLSSQECNSSLAFIFIASNTWVTDLRAIDHMNSNSSLLDSLMPLPIKSIQIANGTLILILGAKNVSLTFPHTLHVFCFSCT